MSTLCWEKMTVRRAFGACAVFLQLVVQLNGAADFLQEIQDVLEA
jgi:hypothetical protein